MKKLTSIIFMFATLLSLTSCGARKSEVSKSEKEQATQTELTDKGSSEKSSEATTDIKQAESSKEDEQVFSEETQTDYTAIDPAKPIIEITGKDTTKIYNANKTIKTIKTALKRQKEAQATVNTSKHEKRQETQKNDLQINQDAKSSETNKNKVTEREYWPLIILVTVVILILLLWRRNKNKG